MRLIHRVGFALALTCIFFDSYSQTTVGPNNPATEADGGGGSTMVPSWTFASGTAFSSNNLYAQTIGLVKNKDSNYLLLTDFGFSVPAGSYIAGITVEVEMHGDGPVVGSIKETSILLMNASGAKVGTNKSTNALIPFNVGDPNTYVTYGGSTDNWGGLLDYTDINSPNFGVALQYTASNNNFINFDINVDHVRITVTYAPGMTAVADGCFNDGATWGHTSPGVAGVDYPDANVAALIPGGRTVTVCAGTTGNCYALINNSNASASTPAFLNLANSSAALNATSTILMLTSLAPTTTFNSSINLAGGTITIQKNLVMTAYRNGGNISSQSVVFNGGTLTVNGDITMAGSIGSAVTLLNMTAANSVLNMGGDLAMGVGASLINGTGTTGTINYQGSSTQIIRSAVTYFNLTFSGGGQKTLEGATAVNGALNMTSGNCNLSAQTLTLGSSTASIGTLSYTAGFLLNGTFIRWFNTSLIADGNVAGLFPVGAGSNYRPFRVYFVTPGTGPSTGGTLSMSHTDPGTSSTSVSFLDNPTATNVVKRTNMSWTLTAANGFNATAGNLNVRIDGNNIGGVGVVTPIVTDLRITLVGSTIGTAGTNAGTTTAPVIRRVSMPAFSSATNTFYIGSVDGTNSPLPIKLTAFNAQTDSDGVQITWTTATEVNNDFFTIERSADGKDFSGIGTVKGSGTTTMNHSYFLKDRTPLNGISYYRLKQTDYDGNATYSKIVSVEYAGQRSPGMTVYPNPSKGNGMTLEISGLKDEDQIPVVIYDMMGRVCANLVLNVDKNSESITASLTFDKELPAGMYILKAGFSQILTSKLMIVN